MQGNLIGGEWVVTEQAVVNVNPSDLDDVVGEYARVGAAEAEAAIAAAAAAFPAWSRSGIADRAEPLFRVATEIFERTAELGELLAREEGKTLAEAVGEVTRAAQIFRFFAGEVARSGGETFPSVRPGLDVEITREPRGPITIITPWNFPIAIPAWKIAPALAYGNTVVFKPAELVPGSAWALSEIISRAGFPEGVFNLVIGKGSEIGDTLIDDPRIAAVTFTGSVGVGRQVRERAVARGAAAQTEMGGKNPLVVLNDANLDTAVECAVNGAFFSTGQRCTASSRLIVERGVHDEFVERMKTRIDGLTVGHALEDGTDIGPVVDEKQLATDLEYLEIGRGEGAELLLGGERVERPTRGHYLSPALFVAATNEMRISREEIFGPVASVIEAADFEEAVALANDTDFGLSSGIVTDSLKHATEFKRRAEAGMVMVNLPTAGVDYHVPFGGTKGSSYGPREQGSYAREFFTMVKTAYTAP